MPKHSATTPLPFAQQPTRPLDFQRALARRDDCVASQAAADQIAPHINGQCRKILDLIKGHPDKTAGELAELSNGELDQVTICKRVSILDREGAIEVNDTGRICTVRGNLARTYRAKESS